MEVLMKYGTQEQKVTSHLDKNHMWLFQFQSLSIFHMIRSLSHQFLFSKSYAAKSDQSINIFLVFEILKLFLVFYEIS